MREVRAKEERLSRLEGAVGRREEELRAWEETLQVIELPGLLQDLGWACARGVQVAHHSATCMPPASRSARRQRWRGCTLRRRRRLGARRGQRQRQRSWSGRWRHFGPRRRASGDLQAWQPCERSTAAGACSTAVMSPNAALLASSSGRMVVPRVFAGPVRSRLGSGCKTWSGHVRARWMRSGPRCVACRRPDLDRRRRWSRRGGRSGQCGMR